MNIFKYAAYRIKNETPELRAEAAASAKAWVDANMSEMSKFDDRRRVAYQAYMTSFISTRLRTNFKKENS